jgi:deoxycytidylate deaminase/dephospho-CoA kinase
MAASSTLVIGLTGAFGSGCTTTAKLLRDERAFSVAKLSDPLKQIYKKKNGKRKDASRQDLQSLGDNLREKKSEGALIDLCLAKLRKGGSLPENIVVDGIRNLGEVDRLTELFGYKFTLIGILASSSARWGRIGSTYTDRGLTQLDFNEDDSRDSNEETRYGQQVALCLDKADILIDNSEAVTAADFKQKTLAHVDLATAKLSRPASQDEILMNMAFSASHSSKCIKRHVGALVVDLAGQVVGVGYNENPIGTHPCIEEPSYNNQCYRDIVRNAHFADLARRRAKCPVCGAKIIAQHGPPWRCNKCSKVAKKSNLEQFFFPDRAISWCTAVHAEVWAVLAAGERGRRGTLYTTTFPCFQCAEKISQAGISSIVFTEAYPDPHSAERLKLAGVKFRQFEGVRSSSFEKIFSKNRPV